MRGKKYPQTDRARAVGIALIEGSAEASRKVGIPERTIQRWADRPEMAELVARTKDQVAEEWWAIVQKGMRRVYDLLDSTDDVQKVATSTAIVTDKMLLLRGEATSRTESTLLRGKTDHEQQLLADVLNRELERRAYADAAGHQAVDPVEEPSEAESGTA